MGASQQEQERREAAEIARALLDDTQLLFRKHIELARQEITEVIDARIKGAMAAAVAGAMGLFALGMLGLAGAWGLATVMPIWLGHLVVGGGFLLVAALAGFFGLKRLQEPSLRPRSTQLTLKEDKEWARARLGR